MAKMKFEGLKEYELKLSKLKADTKKICGKAIYAGASVVADSVKTALNSLPVNNGEHGNSKRLLEGITEAQKNGLVNGFGISPLEDDSGQYNVKLGFDGYNDVKTKKYPKGQPNILIARAVTSGTVFMKKNPAIRKAISQSKKSAESTMGEVLDQEIKSIMK